MKYGLKVVHNNQRDLSTCLCFTSGEKLYMFNTPDGIQRIASQAKLRFGRISCIFVPSLDPNHFLGLPGFYLTTRDGMKESENGFSMKLFGPPGFGELMKSAVYFVGSMQSRS